ncbi:MAG: hypothetical protein ACL93V_00780 [Candidatus Electrothrix sp. YB6]
MSDFEVKAYPELWKSLNMDVERFDKARKMLGDVYAQSFLSQKNRPEGMAYFDEMIAELHGGRIKELFEQLKEEADRIEHPVQLTSWGRKHKADFERLLPPYDGELVNYCQELREVLENSPEELAA